MSELSARPSWAERRSSDGAAFIISAAAALSVCLLVIRARVMGFAWKALKSFPVEVPKMLIGCFYDYLFLAGLTSLFLVMFWAVSRRPKVRRRIVLAYMAAVVVTLVMALVNIVAVNTVGRPFNYQWLYYSGFLMSLDARHAIFSFVSWQSLAVAALSAIGMLLLAFLIVPATAVILRRYTRRRLTVATVIVACLYFLSVGWYLRSRQWVFSKLENPVISFLQSMLVLQQPTLFTMQAEFEAAEFKPLAHQMAASRAAHIRNVLIYVMESVPAEYVEVYGGRYPVTPHLNKYRPQSIIFKNIYAHAPATNKSMVSILASTYPWISYHSLTQEYPQADVSAISRELKRHSYRSGFFNSGDLTFQGANRFLAHQEFDLIQDYRGRKCASANFVNTRQDWRFLDGSDDQCTADSLMHWVGEDVGRPFLAVLWTMMTHYPYFFSGQERNFDVKDPTFNRYLNALKHGDRVIGRILKALEERGLAESTLVVVVGDHGEAFGRHNQITHASKVYEENVHVPLMFINKHFKGEERSTIGGLIDIAPTIMDLLGLPSGEKWQGRSLLSTNRTPRTYFFAPWSDYLFGYREGNRKYIFNATTGTHEIYDLLLDPQENTNLSMNFGQEVQSLQRRLAGWVQYQNEFTAKILR